MKRQAYNPYLPAWEHIPDGEPHIFGNRLYIYGSHDMFADELPCTGDYVSWSAPLDDLTSWRYEGIIYRRSADPMNESGEMRMYAPDVTKGGDGKYYLYYMLNHVTKISVAVCDEPAGEYKFIGYVKYEDGTYLGERAGDEKQFDPAVLTENGKTYLYTGFCRNGNKASHGAMVTVIGEDMLTVTEPPKVIIPGIMYAAGTEFEKHPYFEGPSIRNIGGKYYLVYSSTAMHELCYAVSDKPTEGFAYGGVIVSNEGLKADAEGAERRARGGNNHGGIAVVGNKAYIFYHRQTDGVWSSRQACAEKIRLLPDGRIEQTEITSCGLNGKALNGSGSYRADICCHLYFPNMPEYVGDAGLPRITEAPLHDGRYPYIADMTNGTVAGYKYFDIADGTALTVVSRGNAGVFNISVIPKGKNAGTDFSVKLPASDGWSADTVRLDGVSGTSEIKIAYNGNGKRDIKEISFDK